MALAHENLVPEFMYNRDKCDEMQTTSILIHYTPQAIVYPVLYSLIYLGDDEGTGGRWVIYGPVLCTQIIEFCVKRNFFLD